jgi:flagellar basal body-associated protein FliL
MADAEDTKEQEEQKIPEAEAKQTDQNYQKSLVARLLPWIIMAVVVAICAGAGFGLGRLLAGSRAPEAAESDSMPDESTQAEDLKADDDSAKDSTKVWYYDLDPVVANLNEPGVTRYVRASLTLEISSEVDEKKCTDFINKKKPILTNWLTVYLAGLSLEDVRGDRNLKSIQSDVRDAFNEQLFPDSKPQIKQVLIKEFPVQ